MTHKVTHTITITAVLEGSSKKKLAQVSNQIKRYIKNTLNPYYNFCEGDKKGTCQGTASMKSKSKRHA